MPYSEKRQEVARFMRRLYDRGLTTACGGNVSLRAGDRILITPSGLDKGCLGGDQIGMIAFDGSNLTPELKPSIETGMHLEIYRRRPEVSALVHAHPVTATAFAAAGREINCLLTAEGRAVSGRPVFAPYALMGTPELASVVAEAAAAADCILMANHGVITAGVSLLEAFERLEVLENMARMTILVELLGAASPLTSQQAAAIDLLVGRSV